MVHLALARGRFVPEYPNVPVIGSPDRHLRPSGQRPICFGSALLSGGRAQCRLSEDAMSKLSLGTHPFLLGFDQLERLVERTAKSENGYPPYNIEQVSDHAFRITLAVAGFAEEDLSITVEDRQLVVRGRQQDDQTDRVFLHRGIAARQFQRTFLLADGVEVGGAKLANGLLHVDLQRSEPESVVREITIGKG